MFPKSTGRLLVVGIGSRQTLSASKPRRVGPAESVSMKWSWGYRWEQERSPDWQVSGAITLTSGFHKGRDSPFDRWVQGERSLPRVIERRNVLMALDGPNAL